MDTILEKLVESPKLNPFYAQLHRIVDEEQVRREQFYAILREDHLAFKADNGVIASRAVAGFAVPVRALFDAEENLAVLERMLAS